LSIHPPVVNTPACCQYTHMLSIHLPPVDTLTLWSIHPPPVDVPVPLSIHLCSLLLLWAMSRDVVDDVAGNVDAHIPEGGERQGTTVTWG